MTHKRNTAGLAQAAKQRRQNTIERVKQAIENLIKKNSPINFNSVSKAAQVGKPWLYKENCVRQQIESLRQQTRMTKQKIAAPKSQLASDKSKDHIITMLKEKIRSVEGENKKLKQQIEILYGQLYSEQKTNSNERLD